MSQQESKCPVNLTRARLQKFYNDDSKDGMCSKCHPCKLGIYDAIKIFETIQAGKGAAKHIALLKRIAVDVKDGGMCKKGKDHADILALFLKTAPLLNVMSRGSAMIMNAPSFYDIDPSLHHATSAARRRTSAIEGQKTALKTGLRTASGRSAAPTWRVDQGLP
jgi:hypothetical protein